MHSQLRAPTMVRTSAITENTLKAFFKMISLLVSCTASMRRYAEIIHGRIILLFESIFAEYKQSKNGR